MVSSIVLAPSSIPGIKWLCISFPMIDKSNGSRICFLPEKSDEKIPIINDPDTFEGNNPGMNLRSLFAPNLHCSSTNQPFCLNLLRR